MDPYDDPSIPLPVDRLFHRAITVYRSAFWPFFTTAAIGALLSELLASFLLMDPGDPAPWAMLIPLVVISIIPPLIAQTAVSVIALDLRASNPPNIANAYAVALRLSPRLIAAACILFGSLGIVGVAVLLSPLVLFFLVLAAIPIGVRLSLFVPAIVLEDASPFGSLRLSWEAVAGHSLRTLGIVVLLGALSTLVYMLAIEASSAMGAGLGPRITAGMLAGGAFQPLAAIVTLLLYEDYRSLMPPKNPSRPDSLPVKDRNETDGSADKPFHQ